MTARRQHGFTLLELIVVVGIFGLVAAMAWGGLQSVLETRARTEAALDELAALQRTWRRMRDDFQQLAPRAVRDEFGDVRPALLVPPFGEMVRLSRGGYANPLFAPRPSIQRVGYVVDERRLQRVVWIGLDRAPNVEPLRSVMLDGVREARWRLLDADGQWQEQWPPVDAQGQAAGDELLPRAVEVQLDTVRWGELRWLFATGAGP